VGKLRLNYALPNDLATELDDYCQDTGRKAADVIRQLVSDYALGQMPTEAAVTTHPSDTRRADLWLQMGTLAALDERVTSEGHASRSALISKLLGDYLIARAPKNTMITVQVRLPKALYESLLAQGDVEQAILRALIPEPAKECV